MSYNIPSTRHRTQTEVARSRFITTIDCVTTAEEARAFLAEIRSEMPDASHHVYAFRVGYGNSVTEGMSDDGEPTGTSGPPTLAVLRGYDLGDVALVTTRYFGGTKLGTGGLVRAYSEAAHVALNSLPVEEKLATSLVGMDVPYHLYQIVRKLIGDHQGTIEDETFAGDVTIIARFADDNLPGLTAALRDASSGSIAPVILESS